MTIAPRTLLAGWALGFLSAACAHAADPVSLDRQAIYRRLDSLQALGVGMTNQHQPKEPEASPPANDGQPTRRWTAADWQEQATRQNKESFAKLQQHLDRIKAECGGKLADWPEIGMSDDAFRLCTTHARFGGVRQVVVSEEGGVPLRLYVFPTRRAHKVYTIGGVVTAILP